MFQLCHGGLDDDDENLDKTLTSDQSSFNIMSQLCHDDLDDYDIDIDKRLTQSSFNIMFQLCHGLCEPQLLTNCYIMACSQYSQFILRKYEIEKSERLLAVLGYRYVQV